MAVTKKGKGTKREQSRAVVRKNSSTGKVPSPKKVVAKAAGKARDASRPPKRTSVVKRTSVARAKSKSPQRSPSVAKSRKSVQGSPAVFSPEPNFNIKSPNSSIMQSIPRPAPRTQLRYTNEEDWTTESNEVSLEGTPKWGQNIKVVIPFVVLVVAILTYLLVAKGNLQFLHPLVRQAARDATDAVGSTVETVLDTAAKTAGVGKGN